MKINLSYMHDPTSAPYEKSTLCIGNPIQSAICQNSIHHKEYSLEIAPYHISLSPTAPLLSLSYHLRFCQDLSIESSLIKIIHNKKL